MTYKEAREYLVPVAANCVLPQYAEALEKAIEALEIAESVVRCKDCKHYSEDAEHCFYIGVNTDGTCFCSWANGEG